MLHVFCIVAESISLDLLFVKVAGLSEAHPFLVAQDRSLKVQGILPPFLVKFMKFPLTCALNHVTMLMGTLRAGLVQRNPFGSAT